MTEPEFISARNVNPEAGDHAISAAPEAMPAAEAATRRSWREFPYYARRYGERGWRFSLSDSGFIQTLCHLSQSEANAQVRWLAGLLAARGMPTYLMERHLSHLHEELVKAAPDKPDTFGVLGACAIYLRELRELRVPEAEFRALAARFEEAVADCSERVPNMGVVLVAAIADERAGLGNAVDSLQVWATDAERFDPVWIEAVRQTLAAARARIR